MVALAKSSEHDDSGAHSKVYARGGELVEGSEPTPKHSSSWPQLLESRDSGAHSMLVEVSSASASARMGMQLQGQVAPNVLESPPKGDADAPRRGRLTGLGSGRIRMALTGEEDLSGQMSVREAMSSLGAQSLAVPRRVLSVVLGEFRVTYKIVWRDLSASLIPATLFGLAALHATGEWTAVSIGRTLLHCFAYFSLYIYSFCLCNQVVGFREDRVNKPDRVLPAKMISMRGAVARWLIAMIAFPTVGYLLGGPSILGWAVAWQLIFLSYNFLGLHQHWFTKNTVFITLGTIVQLAPAWELVAPLEPTAWRWIIVVAASFGLTLHLQDLRDVQGDELVGRRTLPIVIGQKWTRRLLAVGIGLLPVVTHLGLVQETSFEPSVVGIEIVLTTLNFVVAWRTLRLQSPKSDHRTYILHTYWFCAVLASGLVLI